jgi:hypothetical protein
MKGSLEVMKELSLKNPGFKGFLRLSLYLKIQPMRR